MASNEQIAEFLKAATWHGSLAKADQLLAAHPQIAASGLHAAAVVGDEGLVRKLLAADPKSVRGKTAPYDGEPLVYLCLSKYLRLDESRSSAFLRAATALLDAGADPNAGFWTKDREFETALYGAAGVAHHAGLTRLLLERGADPNDGETPYHSPETYDLGALKALVESSKLTADSLATMLLRKADWHDYEGIKYLLDHGADPNRMTVWGYTALHQALRRDNGLENIEVMLEHGADPTITTRDGGSAVAIAARRGRGDVLAAIEKRGMAVPLAGVEKLIAACARNDEGAVRALASREPGLVKELLAQDGTLLAEFAGTNNVAGVRLLLDLGVKITALYEQGDGYFDIATHSTALHVAAWKAWPNVVKLLIERGGPVNATDARGRTPLMLAVKACVDSYWTGRRTPESVAALLKAGASTNGISIPCGYDEVDRLLNAEAG